MKSIRVFFAVGASLVYVLSMPTVAAVGAGGLEFSSVFNNADGSVTYYRPRLKVAKSISGTRRVWITDDHYGLSVCKRQGYGKVIANDWYRVERNVFNRTYHAAVLSESGAVIEIVESVNAGWGVGVTEILKSVTCAR